MASILKFFRSIKDTKAYIWMRYVRDELEDQRYNRELVGIDRDGNKYYQYYSYYGLPTKREIRFKVDGFWDMNDLLYYDWLHNIERHPPSEREKQQFYLEEKARYERARLWDERDAIIMQEFRKKRIALQERNAALKALEQEMLGSKELKIETKRES